MNSVGENIIWKNKLLVKNKTQRSIKMIEIFPAIDLHNGQAVRLTQGDYNQVEVFFKNHVEVLDFFNKND